MLGMMSCLSRLVYKVIVRSNMKNPISPQKILITSILYIEKQNENDCFQKNFIDTIGMPYSKRMDPLLSIFVL